VFDRNKTPLTYVYYALYLYFSGVSERRTSQRLACFIKRKHVFLAKNGTGFKNIILERYPQKEKELQNLL